MYNLSYQSPPESCPSPCERQWRDTSRGPCSSSRWDTDNSDGLGFWGRRSDRAILEPGARPPRRLLRACPASSETRGRSSPAILAVRGVTRTAGWGTGLPRLLPSAFLTRNPEAKKKQPFGRRVSIHSPVRLSVHCLHAHPAPTLWPALAGTPVPGRRDHQEAPRRAQQRVRQSQESLAVPWDHGGPAAHPLLSTPGHSTSMKTGHLHLSKMSSSAPCPRAGGAQPPSSLASREHQRGLGWGTPPRH